MHVTHLQKQSTAKCLKNCLSKRNTEKNEDINITLQQSIHEYADVPGAAASLKSLVVSGFLWISEDRFSTVTELSRLQSGKIKTLIYLNPNCQRYTKSHFMTPIIDSHMLKGWFIDFTSKLKTIHMPAVWSFGSWENIKKSELGHNGRKLLELLLGLPMIYFIQCWKIEIWTPNVDHTWIFPKPAHLEASLQ